jgi:ABC-type transporter MlaC component
MIVRLAIIFFLTAGFVVSAVVGDIQAVTAATKKKVSKKRSDFTPEQRKKLMEEARKICKKNYGAASTVYRLDYYKWTVICTEH